MFRLMWCREKDEWLSLPEKATTLGDQKRKTNDHDDDSAQVIGQKRVASSARRLSANPAGGRSSTDDADDEETNWQPFKQCCRIVRLEAASETLSSDETV